MDHFLEPSQLAPVLKNLQNQGQKVVFTNGVFDLLHLGHVTYLQEARKQGDLLVVGLNSDTSVKRIKGPLKPLLPLEERAEMLLALSCVDYTTFFEEDNPFNVIQILQPDVLVKGGGLGHRQDHRRGFSASQGRESHEHTSGGRSFND